MGLHKGRKQAGDANKRPFAPVRRAFWRRHYAPFAKTARGAMRRAERRFALNLKAACLDA